MGQRALLSSEGRAAVDLYVLKNTSPPTEFEPANLGSSAKQANHQTTEDDYRN
jgi:hypothetical protein